MNALAQTQTFNDYKALVCIFLFGGNDSNNTIIPFDTAGYQAYSTLRGPLALAQNTLLPLSKAPNFALHPSLPDIQAMFDGGNAAVVANIGTLVYPTTRTQYLANTVQTPSNLFSHPDQQLEWQNSAPSGATPTGWAGRIADSWGTSYGTNPQIPLVTTVDGDTLFCNGASSSPVAVTPGQIGAGGCREDCVNRAAAYQNILAAQNLLQFGNGVSLVQNDIGITNNAFRYMTNLTDALKSGTPLATAFPPGNSLATQLRQIAQIIQVRRALGVKRQIFFAGLENFDTHANQLPVQSGLLSQVSAAMAAFHQATIELGVGSHVTSFTMSDFSRAFQPNSNNGSDHAWGGHHIVMGGAVLGGKMYGTYPTLAMGQGDDSGSNGRWLPTTSSAQYAATLATWFGVQAGDLGAIFPTIQNFGTANLGFLG
jgi:uncharacterized protein (DUF1501 family)